MPDPLPTETLPKAETPFGGIGQTDRAVQPSTMAESMHPVSPQAHRPNTAATGYGRYALLRPHAQGGLGKVSLARDTKLGRTVALKEIRPDRQPSPEALQRFVNEAEITGLLEHPGIVPIYSLDEDEQGKPYYAMRFIEGQSLQQAIEAYQAQRGRWQPYGSQSEFRKLLNHFISVCNAVAFAHSKGVIHRDLKPENVMLGEYGETLVVDWGLAKLLPDKETRRLGDKEKEGYTAELTGDSSSPCLPKEGTVLQTKEGAVMGTPAYMSPEQARGEINAVGPAADIYALGGILFAILAGRAPYQGLAFDILAKLQQNPVPPSPVTVNAAAPQALAAICQRALAAQPRDRYPTARELAADVERWLADEPVQAFPEPWTVRCRRWMKRHRTLVTTGVGILAVTVPLLIVGLFTVEGARQRESLAKEQERQAKEAERASKDQERQAKENALAARDRERLAKLKARRAVTTLFSDRQLQMLEHGGKLTPAQTQQLQVLAEFYRDCAQEAAVTEAEYEKQAADYFQLGKVLARLGQIKEAITAYGYALEIGKRLQAGDPLEAEYTGGVARTLSNLGSLQFAQRDYPAAEKSFRQALLLQGMLLAANPGGPDIQAEVAITWNNLAELQMELGRHTAAEASYAQAKRLFAQLVKRHPQVSDYQFHLAKAWNNLGVLQVTLGRHSDAEASQHEALALFTRLLSSSPGEAEYQAGTAGAWYSLGYVRRMTGRLAEAEKDLLQARGIYSQLATQHPGNPDYQARLARTCRSLGNVYRGLKKGTEAAQQYTQAQQVFMQLVQDHPESLEYQTDLAGAWNNLGVSQWALGHTEQAEASYRQALRLYEKLTAAHPEVSMVLTDLAATYANLGDLPAGRGDPATAYSWYDRAVRTLEPVLVREPQLQAARDMLRNALGSRAKSLHRMARHAEAARDCHRALTLDDGTLRSYLTQQRQATSNAAVHQAMAQARLGWHLPAAHTVRLLASLEDLPVETWTNLARVLSLCSVAAPGWLPSAPADQDRYAAEAVALLRRSQAHGFFANFLQALQWHNDADLAPLRFRADFQNLPRLATR